MTGCSCAKCVSCCEQAPGWMTPGEAIQAIEAGYARRLMRDWLEPCAEVGNTHRIYVLCPASEGCEGADGPEFSLVELIMMGIGEDIRKGVCTFLKDGLCEVHSSGFKPRQCREAFGCRDHSATNNYEMGQLWTTDEASRALRLWQEALAAEAV